MIGGLFATSLAFTSAHTHNGLLYSTIDSLGDYRTLVRRSQLAIEVLHVKVCWPNRYVVFHNVPQALTHVAPGIRVVADG
jgi:hypothetical protein